MMMMMIMFFFEDFFFEFFVKGKKVDDECRTKRWCSQRKTRILLHLSTLLLLSVCLSVCLLRANGARDFSSFLLARVLLTLLAFCSIFLTETKAEAALADGLEQFLFRLFVTGVVRHAERKETGLSHG